MRELLSEFWPDAQSRLQKAVETAQPQPHRRPPRRLGTPTRAPTRGRRLTVPKARRAPAPSRNRRGPPAIAQKWQRHQLRVVTRKSHPSARKLPLLTFLKASQIEPRLSVSMPKVLAALSDAGAAYGQAVRERRRPSGDRGRRGSLRGRGWQCSSTGDPTRFLAHPGSGRCARCRRHRTHRAMLALGSEVTRQLVVVPANLPLPGGGVSTSPRQDRQHGPRRSWPR